MRARASAVRPTPVVSYVWLSLTLPIAVIVGIASAAGAVLPSTYARETASWSAQGIGQDFANLLVVLPVLVVTADRAERGSLRAFLIWQGLLAYLVYSYVLYAFFVHFGRLFLFYVAALGFSFYALIGSVLTTDVEALSWNLARTRQRRMMSGWLTTVGALFALLWIADISRALARGGVPPSVIDAGLPVNPVHVLDLAIMLPALLITSALLRRRHPLGFAFAVPLATFIVMMGIAIVAMVVVMRVKGVPVPLAMPAIVAAVVVATASITAAFLRTTDR